MNCGYGDNNNVLDKLTMLIVVYSRAMTIIRTITALKKIKKDVCNPALPLAEDSYVNAYSIIRIQFEYAPAYETHCL